MKIGQLVKLFSPKIFAYCEEHDPEELNRLMSLEYSKKVFHLSSYPFCSLTSKIPINKSRRYWINEFDILNKTVRISSQWTLVHKKYFVRYLLDKGIVIENELKDDVLSVEEHVAKGKEQALQRNTRYRNSAIGNAQNLAVRNILSNLGDERFSEQDWSNTKSYFLNCCAYCGAKEPLQIEHAIPINKTMMGEHRLGNLLPSCKPCNQKKSSKDFREFLGSDESRIQKIESYMKSRGYNPLESNEQVAELLEMAYRDVSDVATRYITIINRVLE